MKRKKAAALKYDKTYRAPVVTAVGFGHLAEKIIETAQKSDVPIIENSELVDSLSQIPVGESIPPELYEAVAEIIAFIYRLNSEKNS
jgi:flagellar biosynthesis protein